MFLARTAELSRLQQKLASPRSESILVYGRRRVGKSALIQEALKAGNCHIIQFVCRKASFTHNLQGLAQAAAKSFGENYLSFDNLEHLLTYIYSKARQEKTVLFIDEYPFLRGDDASIDSEFQIAIDQWQHDTSLKLILCGSHMDVMLKIIEGSAPLFGRFTEIMKIEPFDYYDAAKFYPERTDEEKVWLYSIFGGIPFYLNLLEPDLSPVENLVRLLLPEGSILENEIRLQLTSELSKEENANLVLDRIASGITKYADLNRNFPGESGSRVRYTLEKLIGMGLIEKTSPLNAPADHKKQRYSIRDNLLDFYYGYLFREATARSALHPLQFYKKVLMERMERDYVPRKFEQITKEYLLRQNRAGQIEPPFLGIGRFIYHDKQKRKNGEFDVVTIDEHGYTAYECKYRQEPITMGTVNKELWQAQELGLNFHQFGFASRSGFTPDIDRKKYRLISLQDMYA